jgi:CRP/FNR family transcriptional regulator, cyclic AMP receptor protein
MREDDIWLLRRLNFFPDATTTEMQALVQTIKPRAFQKGEMIYFPGELANFVYLVREGMIRLAKITPEGRSFTLEMFNPGDIFGEMALAGQDKRNETAEAMRDCSVWAVPRTTLQGIVEQNPKMALQITKIIGFRRLQIENKLSNLLSTVPVRLARLLLTLAERYSGPLDKGRRTIKIRLTHQDMGDLIAANREIVTATLNRFKKDEVIGFLGSTIVLLNERELYNISGTDKGEI